MKIQRLAIALTVINFVCLMFVLAQNHPIVAQKVAPVLRGRTLEIVDNQGRVRASITVEPSVIMDSKPYPETVRLHMGDPRGGPGVKLTASKESSGLRLGDGGSQTGIDVTAKSRGSFSKLVNRGS